MFVENQEIGERQFNLNAVDRRVRTSTAYLALLTKKTAALKDEAQAQSSSANMDVSTILNALAASSTVLPTRIATTTTTTTIASDMYNLADE
jgi:hypothetical protein